MLLIKFTNWLYKLFGSDKLYGQLVPIERLKFDTSVIKFNRKEVRDIITSYLVGKGVPEDRFEFINEIFFQKISSKPNGSKFILSFKNLRKPDELIISIDGVRLSITSESSLLNYSEQIFNKHFANAQTKP